MHPVIPYLIAAALFGLGCYGVVVRRNAVMLLMAVELLLNAVNLVFVTADATVRATLPRTGQVFALFIIVLAAAEVGVGLALVLQLYRAKTTVALDTVALSPPEDDGPSRGGSPPPAGPQGGAPPGGPPGGPPLDSPPNGGDPVPAPPHAGVRT